MILPCPRGASTGAALIKKMTLMKKIALCASSIKYTEVTSVAYRHLNLVSINHNHFSCIFITVIIVCKISAMGSKISVRITI